ncbi:MAG TPA: GGDEF domain-containing protein [Nitrospirota bacterium]|nr:GGDEF domain-containing protein [Nitrospirota bacterium]
MGKKSVTYRLRSDFQLAIITLMAAVALIGITPFTVLRGFSGQWTLFGIDLTIQTGILAAVLYTWKTGNTRGPSFFLAYFICVMGIIAVHRLGVPGQNWFYAVTVAMFFLIDRRNALVIVLTSVLVLLGSTGGRLSSEAASFYITILVCAMLSYAFSYRMAMQRDQLEALAAKDPLTGVFNRRTLFDDLDRAHEVFRRERRTYAALILDLDEFKAVNDRYGHLAGDDVLIALCRLVEQNIRKGDRLYRFGGEEFVILVHVARQDHLTVMAEKLRRKVADKLTAPDGKPITISIGGAILLAEESVADWFGRADSGLYTAKNSGRNRTVINGAPGGQTPWTMHKKIGIMRE